MAVHRKSTGTLRRRVFAMATAAEAAARARRNNLGGITFLTLLV